MLELADAKAEAELAADVAELEPEDMSASVAELKDDAVDTEPETESGPKADSTEPDVDVAEAGADAVLAVTSAEDDDAD